MMTVGWVDLVGDRSSLAKFAMECKMAKKGYWVGHINVTSAERYKDYLAANAAPFKEYGARFLVRNGTCEVHGRALQGRRHVVIEFESYATAKACHDSSEYQAAARIRDEASTADFVIMDTGRDRNGLVIRLKAPALQ